MHGMEPLTPTVNLKLLSNVASELKLVDGINAKHQNITGSESYCATCLCVKNGANGDERKDTEEMRLIKCLQEEVASLGKIIAILREEREDIARETQVSDRSRPISDDVLAPMLYSSVTKAGSIGNGVTAQILNASVTKSCRIGTNADKPELQSTNRVESVQNVADKLRPKQKNTDCDVKLKGVKDNYEAIILGDSLLKYAGENCNQKGYDVMCYPGIKINELERHVENLEKNVSGKVVVVHVGSNNAVSREIAEEIMGQTMDLVKTVRKKLNPKNIFISGILNRKGVSVGRINRELEWLCERRNLTLLDGNCWIRDFHMARDGVHLNRRGSHDFGELLVRVIEAQIMGKN